ncbi:MAG: riboflavin synthase [Candidatus Gracilibacteria bacterium]
MFTGIITEIGKISSIQTAKNSRTFTVSAKTTLKRKKIGQSISVNGACVSISKLTKTSFSFTAVPETLNKTTFKTLEINDTVNLESALSLGQSIDGHFLLGHIDCTGTVLSTSPKLTISFPASIRPYLSLKGSVAINGVSLTISALSKNSFSVDLIPLTLQKTTLSKLRKKDKVNLEIDLIARYLKTLLDAKR